MLEWTYTLALGWEVIGPCSCISVCMWWLRSISVRMWWLRRSTCSGKKSQRALLLYVGMCWLRLVGSCKLLVSFAEYRLFHTALVQKRPVIWRGLLMVATTYVWNDSDGALALSCLPRGGGLGSRPKKMYGERLGDGVEYHLMSPTPRR